MRTTICVVAVAVCVGCVGGPTKDYYNPIVVGAKFKGPATMERVEDVAKEKQRLIDKGYTVVGSTIYGGKHPEAVELKAQAKRAGANRVVYSSVFIPAPPGSWQFRFGQGFGSGGTGGGSTMFTSSFLASNRLGSGPNEQTGTSHIRSEHVH